MAAERGPKTDVGALIDGRPMSALQIGVVVLCSLTIFLDGYDIQVMALAVPSLAKEWSRPPSDFGWALSAAMVGLSVGSAGLGHFGDRLGRRTAVIAAMVLVGVTTTCTAFATSPEQFIVWRFFTGIGLGVCVPNLNAWTSEYAPLRQRSLAVVSMNAAIALGAFSAGFLAPPVIHLFGWRGIFLVGGIGPLIVAALLWLLAPESLKFLMARKPGDPRIARTLARIAPGVDASRVVLADAGGVRSGSALELISPAFRNRTLLLWAMAALNIFTLNVLIAWLPTLLGSAGWSPDHALQGAVTIQLGGIAGGIGLSFFLDRGLTRPSLAATWILSAVVLLAFLVVPSSLVGWGLLLLAVGAGVSGSQLSLNALSAAYYPPQIKATGVGWVGLVGGSGAIAAGPVGAWLIGQGMGLTQVLAVLVIPVLLCAGGVVLMRREWQAH